MDAALTASILDALTGLQLGAIDQETRNRFSLEGVTVGASKEGGHEIGIRKLEAASLRLASGPLVLEVGSLALQQVVGQVRIDAGQPRIDALEAANAELTGVKVQGPLVLSPPRPASSEGSTATAGAWSLGPLAAADGTIRAEIVDAHLLFDADVTVPIRQGRIDFKDATVEHVGPDSRMGVSRLGLYVDAPNGRSYLYQFSAAPVAGVEYERRSALPGPWPSDRGNLRLQPFGEALLQQGPAGHGPGFTEQSRLLFDRTALSGEVQLGDGRFAAPGVQADLAGRAAGRNLVRLHSEAVGRGLTLEMPSLSVRDASLQWRGTRLDCGELTGAIRLRVFVEGAQMRFAFEVPNLKIAGLRLRRD